MAVGRGSEDMARISRRGPPGSLQMYYIIYWRRMKLRCLSAPPRAVDPGREEPMKGSGDEVTAEAPMTTAPVSRQASVVASVTGRRIECLSSARC